MDSRIERKRQIRKNRKRKKRLAYLKIFLFILLIAVAAMVLINHFLISVITVEGESMQRTLYDGDRLLVKKIGFDQEDITYDDLVFFKGIDDRYYVKRIVAAPGDVIEIINEKVFINGVQKIEDYIRGEATQVYDQNRWFLQENQFFVLGDNRYKDLSKDSRLFGAITFEQIEGIVIHNFSKER